MHRLVCGLLLLVPLYAAQYTGSVRAADQFVPGATVTAVKGSEKLTAFTDENGRFRMELPEGEWEVTVSMFEFTPAHEKVISGPLPLWKEWTLEMPRATTPVAVASVARRTPNRQRPGPGRGFQAAAVQATAPAETTAEPAPVEAAADDEAFMVTGSTSGGLVASSDDETRRQQRQNAGPGRGGATASVASASFESNDSLGLTGFGSAAINSGFDAGAPMPSDGGGRGGGGRGSGGLGGGGRGGGGRGGGGRGNQTARRGPYNGQFASFGNRRRTRPSYTGSVSLTAQNSVLNAAPFSLNGQPSQKPYSAHNNLTATVGGPIRRASFNISYSGALNRNGSNLLGSVPTAAERQGIFTAPIFDPTTGAPFANNVIPASRIDPAAAGLLSFFPQATYPGLVQNYRLISTVPSDTQSIGIRLNAPLTNKDRLNFNVQYQTRDSKSRQLFGYTDTSSGYGLSASAGWSHSFAPRFNNSANLTFSRNNTTNAPFFAYSQNVAGELGITGTSRDPINYGPPSLSFTNFSSLSDSTASVSRSQTTNFTDNITYVVRRKHNFTFGFLYRRLQQNSLNYQNSRGSFSFSGLATSSLSANGQPVQGTGFDFADFLLGLPQSSSLRLGSANNYFRGWAASGFAQDDWRVNAGLTLNLGLRYEYFAPYTELFNHLANLELDPPITSVTVVTAGNSSLPTSLVKPDTRAFSPRIGLAYRPWAKRPFLMRTGYSIFYSGSPYGQIASQLAAQPPFAKTASLSTTLADPLTIENGFAAAPSQNITNTYAIDPNYRLAYAQTWNFTLQNTLPHGLVLETEYIGTKGTDLAISEQPNRAISGTSVATQVLRIADATGFTYLRSGANSTFHAGQLRVTRRFTRGISATGLYTYAKALDNASSFNGTGGTLVQYLDNLRLERGPSSFDQRHHLQTTFLFSSPVGIHGMMRNGGWKTTALAGWTLSGTFSATSGTPLTAYVSGNLANTGGLAAFGNSRAQATGLPVTSLNGGYFNPAAFTTPEPGQFGDAGRNTIPGLFQLAVNGSLNRAFRFGESRRQLQLRINATNALNHVTITSIGTTVNSATYGLPTAASATRNVSLLLRYNF